MYVCVYVCVCLYVCMHALCICKQISLVHWQLFPHKNSMCTLLWCLCVAGTFVVYPVPSCSYCKIYP